MLEIVLSAIIYLAGAITEYETKGSLTKGIMYQDGNVTMVECK